MFVFFFKQKTAYEMRISDWSSDVCSSDLCAHNFRAPEGAAESRSFRSCDRACGRWPDRFCRCWWGRERPSPGLSRGATCYFRESALPRAIARESLGDTGKGQPAAQCSPSGGLISGTKATGRKPLSASLPLSYLSMPSRRNRKTDGEG